METYLITGASRGLGRALALALADRGHRVIATCRGGEERISQLTQASKGHVDSLEMDVTRGDSVQAAARWIQQHGLTLDVLVNNAGVHPESGSESFEELELEWFRQAFETNLMGVARVTRACLPALRQSSRARIVNISSGAGSISEKDNHRRYCYSVSKAALNMLTRELADELRAESITVVSLSPGWVRTDMGGEQAPLSMEESVGSMVRTFENLSLEQTGQFLDRNGQADVYHW